MKARFIEVHSWEKVPIYYLAPGVHCTAFKEKLERQDSEVAVQNSLKTKDIAQQQRLLYFFGGGGGGGVANFSVVLG